MTSKILNSYKRASDANIMIIAHRVAAKMQNNSNFPNAPEALAALLLLLPELQTAINDAGARDKEMVSIKNDKKATLVTLLSTLAAYVTDVSKGDRSKLLSSGFDLNRSKGEKTIAPVASLQVTIDKPNEAVTKVKRVTGARVHIHQCTMDPITENSVWTDQMVTTPTCTFANLPSAIKHWFRVIVVGNNGEKEYSPTVAKIIQ